MTRPEPKAKLTQRGERLAMDQIVAVCVRAEQEIFQPRGIPFKRSSFIMDLSSLPELDLAALLAFPKFDFAHDVFGIMRHMDRSEYPGKLTDCFSPRCTRHASIA